VDLCIGGCDETFKAELEANNRQTYGTFFQATGPLRAPPRSNHFRSATSDDPADDEESSFTGSGSYVRQRNKLELLHSQINYHCCCYCYCCCFGVHRVPGDPLEAKSEVMRISPSKHRIPNAPNRLTPSARIPPHSRTLARMQSEAEVEVGPAEEVGVGAEVKPSPLPISSRTNQKFLDLPKRLPGHSIVHYCNIVEMYLILTLAEPLTIPRFSHPLR